MDEAKLRAWWSHRQGLDGELAGASPSAVLERTGWARSVGGVGPYMTIRTRASSSRAEMDAAAASQEIHELPSARGCTYVVPRRDFALALRVGQDSERAEMNVAYKLGVSDDEIEKLCEAVIDALAGGLRGNSPPNSAGGLGGDSPPNSVGTPEPMSPDQIREATGDASRSLGEEGTKKGMTTTLPLALGRLQSEGLIRRVPVNGRLDQQRYAYTLFQPNPLEGNKLSPDVVYRELAERFFRWVGPATLAEFQFFSGLGVKGSQAIVEHLKLVPVEAGSNRLMFGEDLDEFQSFKPSDEPRYDLVSSLDPISANRRDVAGLLDASLHTHPSIASRGRAVDSALADLPYNAILDRGRLAGFWEYDPEAQEVVWMTFAAESDALQAAIAETEKFVRDDLGDARTFSLDSPKARRPRIDALKVFAKSRS